MPKISQFPSGGVAQNTDLIPVVRNGGDYTVTGYNLASLASYGQAYVGTFTATAGQTVFTLPASPGSLANLFISVDGAVMVPGSDYTWTTPVTLTFAVGLKVGQTVLYNYTTSVPIGTSLAGGVSGQVQYNNSGVLNGTTIGGDATLVATTGALTVTKTAGVAFAASATTNTTLTGNINYTQGGTGSVARTVTNKFQESVSVKDFGAVGDGTTDDTAAITAAFTAAAAGSILSFPPGTYKVSGVNVTGKAITLMGYGATLNCTGATGAIQKTDHGNKLIVKGLSFTGSGAGINFTAAPSSNTGNELLVCDCNFATSAGTYGIYSIGGREHIIKNCYFTGINTGSGIYFSQSVSPFVSNCIFDGAPTAPYGVNYPGTNTGYDAGLILRDCEIMGWATGVSIVGLDSWFVLDGCTVDFNTNSLFLATNQASLTNNYIGSNNNNAALHIGSSGAYFCTNIIVTNNILTGHSQTGNLFDAVLIDGAISPKEIQICNNGITFFSRYGIQFTMTNTNMFIHNNSFSQGAVGSVSPIYCSLGTSDSAISIKHNFFSNGATITGLNVTFAQVNENIGCNTEGRGQVVVGSGVSTYNIAHGLNYTPAVSDCQVVASNAEAANKNVYVSSVDATNLVAGFTSATAANAGVNWRIRRGA